MVASASHLEGEEEGIVEMKANNLPKASDLPPNDSMSSLPPEMPAPSPPPRVPSPPVDESTEDELPTIKRIRKLSQRIVDLMEGHGHTSNRPTDPIATHGIQVPSPIAEELRDVLEGEGQADWMMAADFVEEYILAAEISKAEALEPRTLAEARRCPDWPLWEKAIVKAS